MNQSTDEKEQETGQHKQRAPGPLQIAASVLAAAFGVQTHKNRERDFQQSSIWPFIAAGLIFTVLFILGLMLVASLALSA